MRDPRLLCLSCSLSCAFSCASIFLVSATALGCGGKTDAASAGDDAAVDTGVDVGRDAALDTKDGAPPPDTGLGTPDVPVAETAPPPAGALPPPRPATSSTGGTTQWFVVDRLRLGTSTTTGAASPSAWKDYGFDLDRRNTSLDDSKVSANSCHRLAGSPSAVLVDGTSGIDNNFGAHVMQTVKSLRSDVEDAIEAGIAGGSGTLLLRLDNVVGPDNAHVPGALYATAKSGLLRFDGTDVLPVSSSSVDGSIDKPVVVFATGYMSGGVWVSGDFGSGKVAIPFVLGSTPIVLDSGLITVRVADGSGGIIAGASRTTALSAAFTPWLMQFGICPGNATYDQVVTTLHQSADLVGGAVYLQDTSVECDSISIGLGFSMKKALPPTTIGAPPVLGTGGC